MPWNINHVSIFNVRSDTKLGPANPQLFNIVEETLGFRRSDISSDLRLLIPTFALLYPPPNLTVQLQRI
jgi:hypothetical protein